jgi:Meiotically up-regulated gene 113
MQKRQQILEHIKAIATRDGRAPGIEAFETQTGIKPSEWRGKIWRSWGDAIIEAGYEPNTLIQRRDLKTMLVSYIEVMRHIGRVPAKVDIQMYGRNAFGFPSHTTFDSHFGNKASLLRAVREYVEQNEGFDDIRMLLSQAKERVQKSELPRRDGGVYLMESGGRYKIGRSDNIERRVKQITVALPEKLVLVHEIKTDDSPGIEAYWHRRFAEKRLNGEWFKLTVDDVRAFKRRKFQ